MLQGDMARRERDKKAIAMEAADRAAEATGLEISAFGDITTKDGGDPSPEEKKAFVVAFEAAQRDVVLERAKAVEERKRREAEDAKRRAEELAAHNAAVAAPYREQRRLRKLAMQQKGVYGNAVPRD
jgi:hypothetical protein